MILFKKNRPVPTLHWQPLYEFVLDFSPSVEQIFCVHLVPKEKSDRNCKKSAPERKSFCFPGLTTAMLGPDYRRVLSGNRQEVPLVRTNCRRGIRCSILPQRAAAIKKTVVAGGITAQNRIAARKKPCCLNSYSFVAVHFTLF